QPAKKGGDDRPVALRDILPLEPDRRSIERRRDRRVRILSSAGCALAADKVAAILCRKSTSKFNIMPNDPVTRHFFHGFIRLHILYHATKEPIYGAEITEELVRHGYRLSQGP